MKKYVVLFFCFLAFCSAVFAVEFEMSFGGGFEFYGNWTTASTEFERSGGLRFVETNEEIQDLNFGGFLFFDAAYVEAFVSVYGNSNTLTSEQKITPLPPTGPLKPRTFEKSGVSMAFGILGKYPFELNKFTLYPLLGLSYQIFFSGDYGDEYYSVAIKTQASDFNTLWLHGGVGVNYDLTDSLYLKAEALYGIKLAPTMYDKNNTEFIESKPSGKINSGWVNTFTARLGIGYRL